MQEGFGAPESQVVGAQQEELKVELGVAPNKTC